MAGLRPRQLMPVMPLESSTQIYPPIVRIPPRNADRTQPREFLSFRLPTARSSARMAEASHYGSVFEQPQVNASSCCKVTAYLPLIVAPSRFISIQREVRVRAS